MEELNLTKEEIKQIEKQRKEAKEAQEYSDWEEQYDNCYGKF